MTPTRLLCDKALDLLLTYASGTAPLPMALAAATALTLNPLARRAYAQMNALGGGLLEQIDPVALDEAGLQRVMAQLAVPLPAEEVDSAPSPAVPVPAPLRPYIGPDLAQVRWRRCGWGIGEHVVHIAAPGYRVSLLRIAPGRHLPHHGHGDREVTVVLTGAYNDGTERYERGDIGIVGADTLHRPYADAVMGCVCLAVLSAPIRLTGWIGVLLNPFLRRR